MVVIVVVTDSATLTGTSTGNTLQRSDDRGTVKRKASDNSIESENEITFFLVVIC